MPAYNREQFLGRTLDSVIAQTMPDWELIVSDDGSSDATFGVATEYAERDARISVTSGPNGGVAVARNRGLDLIDPASEYVVFLDSDDRWLPDSLESLIEVLDRRPDLVSVYGLARCIDSDDGPIPGDDMADRMRERLEYRGRRLVAIGPDEPTTFASMVFHNYPATPGLHLVRRRVIDAVGPFDPTSDPADDWDLAIRISRCGSIGFLDRQVLEWRRHGDTLTETSPRWRAAYFQVRAKTLTDASNTPEQARLARLAYLGASRSALMEAWGHVGSRRIRAAARDCARCGEILLRLLVETVASNRRRRRSTRNGPA